LPASGSAIRQSRRQTETPGDYASRKLIYALGLRVLGCVLLLGSMVWFYIVAFANAYAHETEGGLSSSQHLWNSLLGYGGSAAAFGAAVLAFTRAGNARRSLRSFALLAGSAVALLVAWGLVISSF
jgi:hypothetical protein